MRQEIISTKEAKNKKEAYNIAPWASVIIRVDGGFHVFESWDDYYIFLNQK